MALWGAKWARGVVRVSTDPQWRRRRPPKSSRICVGEAHSVARLQPALECFLASCAVRDCPRWMMRHGSPVPSLPMLAMLNRRTS